MLGASKVRDAMEGQIADVRAKIPELAQNIRALETEISQLRVVVKSMWALLKEHSGLTEEQLTEKLKTIDEKQREEQKTQPVKEAPKCTACGRPLNRSHTHCIYCGADMSTYLASLSVSS